MNDHAQLHTLEVVIVAGILLTSIYFVKGFDFSPQTEISMENKIETLGDSILQSLEALPDPEEELSSLLARYLDDSIENNQNESFIEFIASTLPDGTLFNISYINISGYKINSMISSIKEYTHVIYEPVVEFGTESVSNRIVVINGLIYRIILKIFYNLG